MAKLYFKYGTMASAKSSLLLMMAYSLEERGIQFLCIKPSVDDRDGFGVISSRIGISRECVSIEPEDDLFGLMETYTDTAMNGYLYEKPKWVLVDECQFLTNKQVEQLAMVVDEMDIDVMCFGLRTDFKTHLFEGSKRLMELADDIEETKISCKCGKKAIINARVDTEGNIVTEGEQVVIGGDDLYTAVCRRCYNSAIKNC